MLHDDALSESDVPVMDTSSSVGGAASDNEDDGEDEEEDEQVNQKRDQEVGRETRLAPQPKEARADPRSARLVSEPLFLAVAGHPSFADCPCGHVDIRASS